MAIDGAPSALLNGAPSARCPHSESLLKAARIVVEYGVGLQRGIQRYAASRGSRRLAKLERLDPRPKACDATQGDGGRADSEEEEQGMNGGRQKTRTMYARRRGISLVHTAHQKVAIGKHETATARQKLSAYRLCRPQVASVRQKYHQVCGPCVRNACSPKTQLHQAMNSREPFDRNSLPGIRSWQPFARNAAGSVYRPSEMHSPQTPKCNRSPEMQQKTSSVVPKRALD